MRFTGLVAACVGALVAAAASVTTPASHFHLAGDYILGGLFSLHAEAVGRPQLSPAQEVPICKKYNLKVVSYSYLQAMRYAVEEINKASALLPGVRLGYEMVDVCYLTNTIHPILYFLSNNRSLLDIETNYTQYRPRVVAVIGPDSSQAAVTAAFLLSQFLVPQITYSATTEFLGNPKVFPVAFRTIPSAEQQIAVMLQLLQHFKWNWFIVLSSDDDYGQQNLQLLRAQATRGCIAFQETIPVQGKDPHDSGNSTEEWISSIVTKISRSTAKVVIILSLELPLPTFFREVIRQEMTDIVWIAAEAWSIDPTTHGVANISSVGTIFGVAVEEVPVPGMDDFRVRGPSHPGEGGEGQAASGAATCNQECDDCLAEACSYDKSLRGTGDRINFNVYSAVYVVAHALHQLLRCSATRCDRREIYPWELLKEMHKVNFTLLRTMINFDQKGDPPNGFEVIQWQWNVPGQPFKKIASYNSLQGRLDVNEKIITWHTANNTAPQSICSEQCEAGHKKKLIGMLTCCFECVQYSFTCQECPLDMWSEPGKEECFMKQLLYIHWGDAISIILVSLSTLGLLATLWTLALFTRHSATPVVKSAGGRLCFLMIASLAAGFCSALFFVGRPTELVCFGRQTVFSLCFTTCIACITVRSFQIICVFKMAAQLPRAYDAWRKYNGQRVFVAVVLVIKVFIVALNIYFNKPAPFRTRVSDHPAILILMCNQDYRATTVFNNAFDMSLCFLCFCFAYMGKALPKSYNEAKYITLCMTGYFGSWVALFLVMSIFEGFVVIIFEAATVLSNLFSICVGYFGPKCYILFFHPERNTTAFFQDAIQSYTMRQE
ncbi:taste receptor type 1 member 2 [Podarcis lilfordi]|uniref:Taste receptor type 1 member 2 n=1 Tax=Podarcis lilfordi TaxID=74358 RepID=A0AA35KSW9_9SAUR|nr:taste receptor type 1 member 2 [Podarcis lilfordi]